MKATNCKTTKNSAFLKIRRNLFNIPEIQPLLDKDGCTGIGAYIAILAYLSLCDNCIGAFTSRTLNAIASQCKKSAHYIRSVIEDYDLFTVDGENFYSPELCKSMHINPGMNAESIQNQQNDDAYNKYAHAQAHEDIDKDIDKEYSTSYSNILENTESESDSNSLRIDKIFEDEKWMNAAATITGITFTKEKKEILKTWFLSVCVAKGKLLESDLDAKQYLVSLLQPGYRTRKQFDEYLQQYLDGMRDVKRLGQQQQKVINPFESLYDGVRYGFWGESIPDDAPPLQNNTDRWSCIKNAYVDRSEWNKKRELQERARRGLSTKIKG